MSISITTSFFLLLFVATISLGFCYGSFNAGCSQGEREALLKFKHGLKDPSNRLASWVSDRDCCGWFGVVCDNLTNHVLELHLRSLSYAEYEASNVTGDYEVDYEAYERLILGGKVSPSLLNLKHLRYLDLSNNDFEGIHIPIFLGSLKSLRYLNLSEAGFGGMIPHQLGNLSNLHYLNLRGYYFDHHQYVENLHWLSGLSALEFLDLSYVNLSKAFDWLGVVNTLPSLVELHLLRCQLPHVSPLLSVNSSSLSILDLSFNYLNESSSSVFHWIFHLKTLNSLNLAFNHFQGRIPSGLQNITALRKLVLSGNNFNSSIPDWLYGFGHLEFLILRYNDLQGKISSAIGNMTSLISLDLSFNGLEVEGGIPGSFKNLCNLRTLSLSGISLKQDIGKVFEILLGCVSDGLESLELFDCQLFGQLPNYLGQFKILDLLYLWGNSISGPIPMSLANLTSLRYLDLSYNQLNGTLPECFGGLTELVEIYIFDNSLVGDVSETHFANLTKLRYFYASGNQLKLRVSPNWIPPFQLISEIDFGSCHIGPQFPKWLHSLKYLWYLDLSKSSISSVIPIWFWNFSSQLNYLNLSCNQIHGVIPNIPHFVFTTIDLSSNHFKGPLPCISPNVTALDLSNNSFLGSISHFLCYKMHEIKNMQVLNLGENLLSGEIPDCWKSWKYLVAIKLSNNKFSGSIPKSIGTLKFLESLHLRNNNVSGEVPLSLKNCTELVTLDLGENEMEGDIPTWIGERLSKMLILNLRTNKFHGRIPKELCHLDSLQILDLADNSFSGTIPSCIKNFSAMATRTDSFGQIYFYTNGSGSFLDNMLLVMKGKMVEYSTILDLVRSIDLSNNNLFGEIPKEITSLRELQSINLSRNFLWGRIPGDIGAMRSLESIDFSLNQLSGEIPQSMSSLTFLSHLNLSNNNLSGRIPLGTQLQGFDPSIFIGNKLCGLPLTKNCSVDVVPGIENVSGKNDSGLKINWLFVGMAYGFVVGFWSVIGPLCFNRRWRHVYFHFMDRLGNKIWWLFCANLAKLVT